MLLLFAYSYYKYLINKYSPLKYKRGKVLNKIQEKKFKTNTADILNNQNIDINKVKYTTKDSHRPDPLKNNAAFIKQANITKHTNPVNETKKLSSSKNNKIKPLSEKVETDAELITNALLSMRTHIVNEVSENFEKKLEKLDEAIIELISCTTENERLKAKIDNYTRENFRLKKEINSFKSIMPGVYIKNKKDENIL